MAEPTDPSGADGEPDRDRPTVAPFLGALAIIVLVVITIGLVNLFEGDGELTAEQQVARAAVAQNDALQREAYPDFRDNTCAAQHGDETEFLARHRDSKDKKGARFVDDVTGVAVDGDRATATVTYYFEKAPDTKTGVPTTFARQDGTWKVCSTGPS
ncbi:lumazine-binding protein [Mycobacterium sp. NPDC050041]|uniref:Rv0361 family membrane protein n=1 Tax=Mycobacterium sp. NPDC050041 TaxID=3364293 RepID=UPI003C2AC737